MSYRVALLGDIVFGGLFSVENTEVFDYLDPLAEYLKQFDAVVGNLEGVFTERRRSYVPKAIHIGMSPKEADILKFLNVSAVSLANNHSYDFGISGLKKTIETLENKGIEYYGVDNKVVHLENEDINLALSGFCCLSSNPPAVSRRSINILKPEEVRRVVQELSSQGYYNIVSCHWGDENTDKVRAEFVDFSTELASNFSVCFHGHHPHVPHPVGQLGQSVIAYSLGNFCMPDLISKTVPGLVVTQTDQNRYSFILELTFDEGKLSRCEVTPFFMSAGGPKLQNSCGPTVFSDSLRASGKGFMPAQKRKDLQWIWSRLGYHFIFAFMTGFANRYSYKRIFKRYI